jgi:hypothetical protein
MLIFGLLEVVMEVKILESTLLQVDNNNERKVLISNNLPTLLRDWRNCVLQLGDEKQCRQWASRIEVTLMQAEGMFTNETFSYSVFRKQGLHEVEDIG